MRRGRCSPAEAVSYRVAPPERPRDRSGRRLDDLLLARLHVLERYALVAEDRDVARAEAVGVLELALELAAGELLLDGEPRAPCLGGQRERRGLAVVLRRGDEEVDDGRHLGARLGCE